MHSKNCDLLAKLRTTILLVCLLYAGSLAQSTEYDTNSENSTLSTTTTPKLNASTTPPTTKPSKGGSGKKDNLASCPPECLCETNRVNCDNKRIKTIPNMSKLANISSVSLKNNQIDLFDFNMLPLGALEYLDLTNNSIKLITPFVKKATIPSKLKTLNLSANLLEDLGNFSSWSMGSLELLDLSHNPLKELTQASLNNTKNVQTLRLDQTKLTTIHEQAFFPLGQLKLLNMSGVKLMNSHLGDRQFAQNQKLETLDLTDNGLVEVPFALRSTSSITKLILNSNSMTSLRRSDFINRTQLLELEIRNCTKLTIVDEFTFSDLFKIINITLCNNPKLRHISPDAFARWPKDKYESIDVIDLRDNDIVTMADPIPLRDNSGGYLNLLLSGNPWHCDCQLKWLQDLPKGRRSNVHCKTPELYKDMEISQFFNTIDCELVESDRSIVMTGILLFLLGVLVALVVQKNDLFRKIFWRERPYSTIYYTKASFPSDTV